MTFASCAIEHVLDDAAPRFVRVANLAGDQPRVVLAAGPIAQFDPRPRQGVEYVRDRCRWPLAREQLLQLAAYTTAKLEEQRLAFAQV